MHLPESTHLWALFVAGHGLHVLKRASLSAKSRLSGLKTRLEWLRTNALTLAIRLFVNAAGFSYWIAHPAAATQVIHTVGIPFNLTVEPATPPPRSSASPATACSTGPPPKSPSSKRKSR